MYENTYGPPLDPPVNSQSSSKYPLLLDAALSNVWTQCLKSGSLLPEYPNAVAMDPVWGGENVISNAGSV